MARTAAFDRELVLEAALTLFWEHGYAGTSLLALEQATGLRPGSIYNSFGSKKGLFIQVLAHYVESVVTSRVDAMLEHPDPLMGIHSFFVTAYEQVPIAQLHGCLLTNTATEVCIEQADIRNAVKAGTRKMEQGFRKALAAAQQQQQISQSADIKQLALHLTASFQGLEVMARLYRDKKQLRSLCDTALAAITHG